MSNFVLHSLGRLFDHFKIRRDPVRFARKLGVRVGEGCRLIEISRTTFGTEPFLISLGDRVTVTNGVQFITHDGGVWVFRRSYPDLDVLAPISIGNDVFLGIRAILLPGVCIGDNCVVGAGSVVSRSIPSNSVAEGVPARVIKETSDYQKQVLSNGLHLRSWSATRKRKFLSEHFGDTEAKR